MSIQLKIPAYPSFSDDELAAFCMANPHLGIERNEHNQFYICSAATSAVISSKNSELTGKTGIWNTKQVKYWIPMEVFFWPILPCVCRI